MEGKLLKLIFITNVKRQALDYQMMRIAAGKFLVWECDRDAKEVVLVDKTELLTTPYQR